MGYRGMRLCRIPLVPIEMQIRGKVSTDRQTRLVRATGIEKHDPAFSVTVDTESIVLFACESGRVFQQQGVPFIQAQKRRLLMRASSTSELPNVLIRRGHPRLEFFGRSCFLTIGSVDNPVDEKPEGETLLMKQLSESTFIEKFEYCRWLGRR